MAVDQFSFDSTLINYGENQNTILDEIRKDLRMFLSRNLGSQFFGRSAGAGLADLENEPSNEIMSIIKRVQIVETILSYNNTVPGEKQVLVSQETVNLNFSKGGELEILIYVYPVITLLNGDSTPVEITVA
jgi:hypothetical protein